MIFCTGGGMMSNTYRKVPDNDSVGTEAVTEEVKARAISRALLVFFGRNCLDIFLGSFWVCGFTEKTSVIRNAKKGKENRRMSEPTTPWHKNQIVHILLSGVVTLCTLTYYMYSMKSKEAVEAEKQKKEALARFSGARDIAKKKQVIDNLSEQEASLLQHIILPSEIDVCMSDIGGLTSVRDEIHQIFSVLKNANDDEKKEATPQSKLVSLPKGILLQGPPGTGKTMIAKAIAKEYSATFINVSGSLVNQKMLGDSEKIISAIFTLAHKLAPTIIFFDEIDGICRKRSLGLYESSAYTTMKTELLQKWDGLLSHRNLAPVIVLGATNRPGDVDEAVLRRLSNKFVFNIPDEKDRYLIFERILAGEKLGDNISLRELAQGTDKYNGSDISELCKSAAQSAYYSHRASGLPFVILKEHFDRAKLKIKPSESSS
jgi:SpoVK/Ycf46/Vps4 family AAA+-type ATPase